MERTRAAMLEVADRLVAALDAEGAAPSDAVERARAEGVIAAAGRLRQVLNAVPWAFVLPSWIVAVESGFEPVLAAVESWASSEDRGAFPVEWDSIGPMWSAVGHFLPAIPTGAHQELVADVAAFRGRLENVVEDLSRQVVRGADKRDELAEHLDALDNRQKAIIEDIEARHAAYVASTAEQISRLEAAIRENQNQFSTAQAKNLEEFGEILDAARTALGEALGKHSQAAQDKVDDLTSDAKLFLDRLVEIEAKATKSYNAIGTASVAGFYQAEANKQRTAANVWRIVGVVVLSIFAVAAVFELIFGDASPSIEHTIARLPIAAAAAALATYTLRESGTHRRQETELRQRELDVSSIGGVLANIVDAPAAERVKLEHARRLFGSGPLERDDPHEP